LIREAVFAGIGISLLSTWDIGPALQNGELQLVLPEYRGMSSDAIYAVYPSRDFMPSKVHVFIEFLSDLYGLEPYWNKALNLDKVGVGKNPDAQRIKKSA
jgi:DNA-binding transcriptional LysR family regulator